ncbi:MAG: hypothetical protein VX738_10130 [Planctomycetota bacterium]|nr:hypothetical protein [Planctomycetota bacterium]
MTNRILISMLSCVWFASVAQHPVSAQSPPKNTLPWKQNNLSDRKLPFSVASSTTAEQMLDIFGVGESELRYLIDFEPVAGKDIDTIGNLLSVFPKLSESDIRRWSIPTDATQDSATTFQQLTETIDKHRIRFFTVHGRAYRVQRQPIVAEAARLIGFNSFFWVFIHPDNSNISIRVATRKLPIAWFPDSWKRNPEADSSAEPTTTNPSNQFDVDQIVKVNGLLLKVAQEDGPRELVMAATRVQWLPENISDEHNVHAGMVLLSQHGFDAGLLDEIRRTNGQPLQHADREAFYQILEILQNPKHQKSLQATTIANPSNELSITDYLKKPRNRQGQFVKLTGDVRQISQVTIANPKMQQRLGRKHYWQLDMSVAIGDESIQLKANSADTEGMIFQHQYPVQICVAELPIELQQAMDNIRTGMDQRKLLRERVTVRGVFFKLWSYDSGRSIQAGEGRVQLSPLIMAHHITVHPTTVLDRSQLGMYVALVFISALGFIVFFVIRMGRQDKDARQRTVATRHGKPDSQTLDLETR